MNCMNHAVLPKFLEITFEAITCQQYCQEGNSMTDDTQSITLF